jgi:hypothetical protein
MLFMPHNVTSMRAVHAPAYSNGRRPMRTRTLHTQATSELNELATNSPNFPSVEYYSHQLTVTNRVNIFVDDTILIAILGLIYLLESITSYIPAPSGDFRCMVKMVKVKVNFTL